MGWDVGGWTLVLCSMSPALTFSSVQSTDANEGLHCSVWRSTSLAVLTPSPHSHPPAPHLTRPSQLKGESLRWQLVAVAQCHQLPSVYGLHSQLKMNNGGKNGMSLIWKQSNAAHKSARLNVQSVWAPPLIVFSPTSSLNKCQVCGRTLLTNAVQSHYCQDGKNVLSFFGFFLSWQLCSRQKWKNAGKMALSRVDVCSLTLYCGKVKAPDAVHLLFTTNFPSMYNKW